MPVFMQPTLPIGAKPNRLAPFLRPVLLKNIVSGVVALEGNLNSPIPLSNIDALVNIADSAPLSVLRIQNAVIDAPSFSDSLKPFSNTIREIHLENVSISGQFNRIHLPNISVFVLKLVIPESEWDHMQPYQEAIRVHSYLFFDPIEGQDWEMKDVTNLASSVEILYEVHGFTFLQVSRRQDELSIYVPYCDEILKNTKVPFRKLSLAACSVSKMSIPENLEYLNFFDVDIQDGHISEILAKTRSLRYLFLDLSNVALDVADLPKALISLSLGTLNLTNSGYTPATVFPDLITLSFGFNHVTPKVYDNFENIFPHITQAAAIGWQAANYKFLETCLNSRIASIVIEDFDRNGTTQTGMREIEEMLRSLDILKTDINFMLMLPTNGDRYVGFPLTKSMGHAYRYTLLGWYRFLSVTAYNLAEKYII